MARAALVFDINGVLADVRKKSQPAVPRSSYPPQDQFTMPNTQKVYLRPGALDMLFDVSVAAWMCGAGAVIVGIWTSRLARNAVPIIEWLERQMHERYHPNCPFRISFLLSGEDCEEDKSHTRRPSANPYKPTLLKRSDTMRSRLEPRMLAPDANLLFLDDNPDQLVLDQHAWFVGCDTFDAARNTPDDVRAQTAYMNNRKDIIKKWLQDYCNDKTTTTHMQL